MYKLMFPPDLLKEALASHVASFPHICKLQQIISQCPSVLYDLSAILQAERLAFHLYDALKICSTIVPQLSK